MAKLSIIIPAYNEERTISEIVNKALKSNVFGLNKEIIIVDNGSTDNTLKIARNMSQKQASLSASEAVIKIFLEKEKGKGAAVKCGFKNATGDILLIQDADLEYDPNDYEAMLSPILSSRTEAVNGVRIENRLRESDKISAGILGKIGNGIITLVTNILYSNNAKEYEGCYKAFTKKLAGSIEVKANDFDFENELICKILKKGIKPVDVPIHYYPRSYAEGKKINWRHGFKILWTIIITRFI